MKINIYTIIFISILLSSCAGYLSGSFSTANYSDTNTRKIFKIIGPNTLTLKDKQIRDLISKKLITYGYSPASNEKEANIAVLYKLSIGQGSTYVSSRPDIVFGGQKVSSSTRYPRFMQIMIIDLYKSKLPDKVVMIWQGEVTSKGSSTNEIKLTENFLDILFENYGKTITDESFHKIVTW